MDVESENNIISIVADDVKQEPVSDEQLQYVIAKIRPILPDEKASYRHGEKMEWLLQCPFCAKWVGVLVEHVKSCHQEENFRQIKTRCPVLECDKLVVDIKNHIKRVHEGVKKYKCNQCASTFKSNYYVNKHIENIHTMGDIRVQCKECDGSFKFSSIEVHIKHVHRDFKLNFPCPEKECGKVFGSNTDLERHVQGFHKKLKSPCPECGKSVGLESLAKHIKIIHRGAYPFQCSHCEKGFQSQKDLKNHVIVKHTGTYLLCKASTADGVECRKVVFSEASLLKHVENFHLGKGLETVPCPQCDTSILPCYMAYHISTAHSTMQGVQCVVVGCGVLLGGGDDLKNHLDESHSSLNLEWCTKCSKATTNLSLHNKVMHIAQQPFQPEYGVCLSQACSWEGCDYKGHSSSNLADHLYNKHMRKTCITCGKCGMKTKNMEEHIRVHHTKEKIVECEVCKKLFLSRAILTKHMKTHKARLKTACSECGARVNNLRQHVRFFHNKELPFKCNKSSCYSQGFTSKYSLNKHIEAVHEGIRTECPQCFKMVSNLRNHKKIVHDKIRDQVCPMCQKTFQNKAHVRNHVSRVHLGLKEKCPECGKQVQDLKSHRNFVHKKVANFACDQCDRKCITNSALKNHVSSVHMGEKVECIQCGEKVSNAYLSAHTRTQHTEREKFDCELCGKLLTCRTSLAKHIRRVHMEVREKCSVCGLETKDLYRHNRYTDCGKEGYVVRKRATKRRMIKKTDLDNNLVRKTRSRTKIANLKVPEESEDSDVHIEEITDMYKSGEEDQEEREVNEISPWQSMFVKHSASYSPIPITDLLLT